ncbi:hypothetical protein V6N12_044271 [Hibiscus sabdariffa]|uniref:Uncharacterized protein n=1 Tax=Hibiscus sabdariffa TaxID=183260 RepID=A0ABR2DIE7_9ROSI
MFEWRSVGGDNFELLEESMFPGRMVKGKVYKDGNASLFHQSGMLLAWLFLLHALVFISYFVAVHNISCLHSNFPERVFGHAMLSWFIRTNGGMPECSSYHFIGVDFPRNLFTVRPSIDFYKMLSTSLNVSGFANVILPFWSSYMKALYVISCRIAKGFWCYFKNGADPSGMHIDSIPSFEAIECENKVMEKDEGTSVALATEDIIDTGECNAKVFPQDSSTVPPATLTDASLWSSELKEGSIWRRESPMISMANVDFCINNLGLLRKEKEGRLRTLIRDKTKAIDDPGSKVEKFLIVHDESYIFGIHGVALSKKVSQYDFPIRWVLRWLIHVDFDVVSHRALVLLYMGFRKLIPLSWSRVTAQSSFESPNQSRLWKLYFHPRRYGVSNEHILVVAAWRRKMTATLKLLWEFICVSLLLPASTSKSSSEPNLKETDDGSKEQLLTIIGKAVFPADNVRT